MRKRLGLALLASGVLVLGSAGIAQARSLFGVWYGEPSIPSADLNRMVQGKVGSVRWPFYWGYVESSPGVFNWSTPDSVIGDLAAKRIPLLPILYTTPPWVNSDPVKPPLSPTDRQYWKRFVHEAVNRYKPGGAYWNGPYQAQHPGAAPLPVRKWQVWNEPNLREFFHASPPVKKYAQLLNISHNAIKGADGHAKVVLAGMPPYAVGHSWRFLNRLYGVPGVKADFDIAALHPYAPSIKLFNQAIKKTRRVMKRNRDAHTKLYLGEFGWGSAKRDPVALNMGLQGQKRMLRRSFRDVRQHRRAWKVTDAIWYVWRDPPPNSNCSSTFCQTAGLFRFNGQAKPSWNAFKHFTGAG